MNNKEDSLYFRERYRIPATRLQGKNYAETGMYYVTICTKNRVPWFGEIHDENMELSNVGWIIDNEWNQTKIIRPYVTLDKYVIMPDHFHAIIRINVETPRRGVSTNNPHHRPEWKSHSLGSIINQFKSICTKHIRISHPDFAWQPRYYDHVIRDHDDLERIRWYIKQNPSAWHRDHA